jgi:hypothetical protein
MGVVGHVRSEQELVHDAGINALEPMLPRSDLFVGPIKSERLRQVGHEMPPRADECLAWHVEA